MREEDWRSLVELEHSFVGDDLFLATKDDDQEKISFDKTWANLSETVKECQKCSLCDTRNHTVFGEGDVNAKLFFVGEAPGKDEDLSGKPFVGRAGKLLTKMIIAMGLQREDVFIANILKCRPPDNRNPSSEEIEKCVPYLKRQISIIQPKILCTLGSFATKTLLEEETPISKLRGKVYSYEGVSLVPTFHPAYLLRNASMKAKAWQDLQLVMKLLDTR